MKTKQDKTYLLIHFLINRTVMCVVSQTKACTMQVTQVSPQDAVDLTCDPFIGEFDPGSGRTLA
ncbi:hypothetical protein MOE96_15750, partial [Bacillus inaquosorum]|uniref:hypothetical protein n=1 Tax=Bacillus inaquosorum TaxID=483913 RepID=UPI00227F69AC